MYIHTIIIQTNSTDKIRNIIAVGEPPGCPTGRVVNAVRRSVCPSRGGQVVVVAHVHQRVSEHEKCSSVDTCRRDEQCGRKQGQEKSSHGIV